jgi:hypothetical protein
MVAAKTRTPPSTKIGPADRPGFETVAIDEKACTRQQHAKGADQDRLPSSASVQEPIPGELPERQAEPAGVADDGKPE